MINSQLIDALDSLKQQCFNNSSKIDDQVTKISMKSGITERDLVEAFVKDTGMEPREYTIALHSELKILDEGVGDFIKDKLAVAGNKFVAKYGFGAQKASADARLDNRATMNAVLKAWTKVSAGGKVDASEQNLSKFLLTQGFDPKVIRATLKDFKTKFKNPIQGFTQSMATQQKQAVTAGKINTGTQINENILPGNSLRDFFLKAVELQVSSDFNTKAKNTKTQMKNQQMAQGISQQAQQAQQTQPTVPSQPTQKSKVSNKTIDSDYVTQYITKMKPTDKVKFIGQNIIGNLSNQEIQQLFQSLSKK